MKTLKLFSFLLVIAFISLSCEKAEKTPVQTAETEVASEEVEVASEEVEVASEEIFDPNYFQGIKRFCEFLKAWEYEVTITGDDITIKKFPGSDNEFHPDKSKAVETHKGMIANGKIIVELPEDCDHCGPDLAETMFKYKDGVFSALHFENDYNDYQECN